MSYLSCPSSVTGHAQNDRSGLCCWCGRRVDPAVPAPPPGRWDPSELRLAYDEFYDPDFGALTIDAIRDRYEMGQES